MSNPIFPMDEAFSNGLVMGLMLSALIGPVFFALIQTSIEKGFLAGAMMAIGISLSDTLYIIIINLFIYKITNSLWIEQALGLAGGVVLIIIGMRNFLDPGTQKPAFEENQKTYRKRNQLMKGFVLNLAHPGVFIFWLGVVSVINVEFNYSLNEKFTLFSTCVGTVIITDLVKSFTAGKLKHLISDHVIVLLNKFTGILLSIFGVYLILNTIWPEFWRNLLSI